MTRMERKQKILPGPEVVLDTTLPYFRARSTFGVAGANNLIQHSFATVYPCRGGLIAEFVVLF